MWELLAERRRLVGKAERLNIHETGFPSGQIHEIFELGVILRTILRPPH